jgi:hypothetical protein
MQLHMIVSEVYASTTHSPVGPVDTSMGRYDWSACRAGRWWLKLPGRRTRRIVSTSGGTSSGMPALYKRSITRKAVRMHGCHLCTMPCRTSITSRVALLDNSSAPLSSIKGFRLQVQGGQ